jgi:hypothetical protein
MVLIHSPNLPNFMCNSLPKLSEYIPLEMGGGVVTETTIVEALKSPNLIVEKAYGSWPNV